MVCASLSKYLKEKDKNNVLVCSWAVPVPAKPGIAKCTVCDKEITFKSGKAPLLLHSERQTHIDNAKKKANTVSHQITIENSISNQHKKDAHKMDVEKNTRLFEISLSRSLSNHKISLGFLPCIQQQLKKYCGDSEVVQNMKLSRYKGEVMIRHGVGKTYQDETISLMIECDGFSIGFDESEVNKISELKVVAKIAVKAKVHLRHYRTLDLFGGTAEKIVEALISEFEKDNINYKKKLFSGITDGCNTMIGGKGGVKKKLAELIDEFFDGGSCIDHHLCNALKYGVTAFDLDIQLSLVNLFQDLGGAKGRGIKKKKDFENLGKKQCGVTAAPFKKFVVTRFRCIRMCLTPVLKNWDIIIKYYGTTTKLTERQELLKSYFVDREWGTLLNLKFVYSAIRELVEAIDIFEQRKPILHFMYIKMESILRSQILKFHNEVSVTRADDNLENITKKSGSELLAIDVDNKETLLSRKKVFIGEEAYNLIKQLDLMPKSTQLKTFYEGVYKFHKVTTRYLIKYFKTGLESTELEYMSALSPKKCRDLLTAHKLKYLAHRYTKLVRNIEENDAIDKITSEINSFVTDDEVAALCKDDFETFWNEVYNIQEADWKKYPILPRFVFILATLFNSESERGFSVQTDIHRDPKRNMMIQETFDAHMQVHYGVECEKSREMCEQCIKHIGSDTKPQHHCHCTVAEITDAMVEDSRTSWRLELERQTCQKTAAENNKDVNEEKVNATKEESVKRMLKFVTGLKTRSSLLGNGKQGKIFVVNKPNVASSSSAASDSDPSSSSGVNGKKPTSTSKNVTPASNSSAAKSKPTSTSTNVTSASSASSSKEKLSSKVMPVGQDSESKNKKEKKRKVAADGTADGQKVNKVKKTAK